MPLHALLNSVIWWGFTYTISIITTKVRNYLVWFNKGCSSSVNSKFWKIILLSFLKGLGIFLSASLLIFHYFLCIFMCNSVLLDIKNKNRVLLLVLDRCSTLYRYSFWFNKIFMHYLIWFPWHFYSRHLQIHKYSFCVYPHSCEICKMQIPVFPTEN